jgi:hypothetical protein
MRRYWIRTTDGEHVAGPFYDDGAAEMCLDALVAETGAEDRYEMTPPSGEKHGSEGTPNRQVEDGARG